MSRVRSLENRRWLVEFYHQWDSFTPRVNWRDFTFICIEGEWNHSWPLVEFRVVLLGLGLRVVRQLDSDDEDEGALERVVLAEQRDATCEPLLSRRPSSERGEG